MALSDDHKPDKPSEKKRIEDSGGVVKKGSLLNIPMGPFRYVFFPPTQSPTPPSLRQQIASQLCTIYAESTRAMVCGAALPCRERWETPSTKTLRGQVHFLPFYLLCRALLCATSFPVQHG